MAELTRELRKQSDLCRNAAAEIERLEQAGVDLCLQNGPLLIQNHDLKAERDALLDALRDLFSDPGCSAAWTRARALLEDSDD